MMICGSICSGIGAPEEAWKDLGMRFAFASEIEKFPIAVHKFRHPGIPMHGDFTTIKENEYEPIDLLVGGTPCQSFSVAGLRGGMADDRGNLALEFLKLAQRTRPRWLVWENVPGVLSSNGGRDFGSFLGGLGELGYGFAYRILDAQYIGVPQRRRRVFAVAHSGDWRRAAAVLFERQSLSRDIAPSREPREAFAPTLVSRPSGGGGLGTGFDINGGLIPEVACTLLAKPNDPHDNSLTTYIPQVFGGGQRHGPRDVAATLVAHGNKQDPEVENFVVHGTQDPGVLNDLAHPLGRNQGQENVIAFQERGRTGGRSLEIGGDLAYALTAPSGGGRAQERNIMTADMAVRRMTPRECERLQGFPDDYTRIQWRGKDAKDCPDGPRYKALGNSMAVPVMRWIGERILMVNEREVITA